MTAAAAWTAGGLWDHGLAALAVFGLGFRGRALSTLSAAVLIVTHVAAAVCALIALRAVLRSDRHA